MVFLPQDPLLSIDQDNKDVLRQSLPAIPASLRYFVKCSNSTPVQHLRMNVIAFGFMEIYAVKR